MLEHERRALRIQWASHFSIPARDCLGHIIEARLLFLPIDLGRQSKYELRERMNGWLVVG